MADAPLPYPRLLGDHSPELSHCTAGDTPVPTQKREAAQRSSNVAVTDRHVGPKNHRLNSTVRVPKKSLTSRVLLTRRATHRYSSQAMGLGLLLPVLFIPPPPRSPATRTISPATQRGKKGRPSSNLPLSPAPRPGLFFLVSAAAAGGGRPGVGGSGSDWMLLGLWNCDSRWGDLGGQRGGARRHRWRHC